MTRGAVRRAAAAAVIATAVLAVPAADATTYRYWTYWTGDVDGWTYSSVGPGSAVPQDGTVQGWRFAVTEGVRGQGKSPRLSVAQAFSQFCGSTPEAPGRKRVAVVLDFGEASDAPDGQVPPTARGTCVVTEPTTTGARILSSAAQVRTDRGLVCAIAGYPAGECAPALEESEPTRSPRPSPQPRESSGTATAPARDSAADSQAAAGASPEANSETGGATSDEPASAPADRNGGADDAPDGTGRSPTARPGSSGGPAQSPSPGASTPSPYISAGAAGGTVPPSPPVFVEASTLEEPTSGSAPAPWLPLLATGAALGAIGGVIVWRRRSSRAPRW